MLLNCNNKLQRNNKKTCVLATELALSPAPPNGRVLPPGRGLGSYSAHNHVHEQKGKV